MNDFFRKTGYTPHHSLKCASPYDDNGSMRALSLAELNAVSGGCWNWDSARSEATIDGYAGLIGGAVAGGAAAALTGGALAPAIGVGAVAGGLGGLATGFISGGLSGCF